MTINVFELIVFSISLLVLTLSITDAVRLRLKISKLNSDLLQARFDSGVYMIELAKVMQERDEQSVEQTEGFLKFVSDSRDWAFQYIEEVQDALVEFQKVHESVPISHDMSVEKAQQYLEAYNKLIAHLPKDSVVK